MDIYQNKGGAQYSLLLYQVVYLVTKSCEEGSMAQSLKNKKQNYISIEQDVTNTNASTFDSMHCVVQLPQLWNTYNSLPDCVERDYVWDEIFTTLSSLLKVVLKHTPETKTPIVEDTMNYTIN